MSPQKVDRKTISEHLDIEVTHLEAGYSVRCINKNPTQCLAVRINFDNCTNLKVNPLNDCKIIANNIVEGVIQPKSTQDVAQLDPIDPAEKFSYKYTCATQLRKPQAAPPAKPAAPKGDAPPAETGVHAQPPEGTEETEVKQLTENLDILVHSIKNGYNLQLHNKDESATFSVTLDLSASINLMMNLENTNAKMDGKVITLTVAPNTTVKVVDMPVENWDTGSCELRYKAAIKKMKK